MKKYDIEVTWHAHPSLNWADDTKDIHTGYDEYQAALLKHRYESVRLVKSVKIVER